MKNMIIIGLLGISLTALFISFPALATENIESSGLSHQALRPFNCFAGSPMQSINNIEATDKQSAILIAKNICLNIAPHGFEKNCYNAYANCNDLEVNSVRTYRCFAGSPMQYFHSIQAGDKKIAISIAKKICVKTAPQGFENNCYNAYSECKEE